MPLPVGAIAAFGPFIEYIRPAKSPYLLMGIFGTVATIMTCTFFRERDEWLMLIVPQYIALLVFSMFSYWGKNEQTKRRQEEQLRFSRAVSIIAALMCLVIGSKCSMDKNFLFNFNYFVCLFQLVVFMIYTAARLYKEEKSKDFNFFQFATITSVYLVGATVSISQIGYDDNSYMFLVADNNGRTKTIVDPFFVNSLYFYMLWTSCQIFWLKHILSLITVSIVDEQ